MQKFNVCLVGIVVSVLLVYVAVCLSFGKQRHGLDKNSAKHIVKPARIEQDGPVATRDFTTVVSVYFALNQSKHGSDSYEKWISSFLRSVRAPLVIFIDPKSFEKYRHVRTFFHFSTTYLIYESVWHAMSELETRRNMSYAHNYQQAQPTFDIETYHTPNLYALWNLKPYLTYRASQLNPYESEFFFYTDSGGWRQGIIPNWPNDSFVRHVVTTRLTGDRVLLGQVGEPDEESFPFGSFLQGTFLAGGRKALDIYQQAFYMLHDDRLTVGDFIGKDQTTMNLLLIDSPKRKRINATLLQVYKVPASCGNYWFFYQRYFAPQSSYNCSMKKESLLVESSQLQLKAPTMAVYFWNIFLAFIYFK